MDARIEYGDRTFRIMQQYTVRGDVYVCRDIRADPIPFGDIGFPKRLVDALIHPRMRKGGLILWTGSAGAGKSTSQASYVTEFLKTFGGTAWTVENPAEIDIDGPHVGRNDTVGTCYQTEVKDDSEFAVAIQRLLRAAPNLIMLGEIRTPSAAAQAVLAGMSGHVVSSTLHGSDVSTALERLKNLVKESGLDAHMLADALSAVIHQTMTVETFADRSRRLITVSPLVIGSSANESSTRANLRKGDYSLLSSEIARQKTVLDQPPTATGRI
ncbi:ATPase, T2SS/T4P/T4SS family [Paraburkholderia sp. SIMBA_054]|uniref:ATPase, T2SS/T4P/T4SS family n=1 Tax=Paraburkholderia sp. SIMBA_054 TaxID=3085795 RepID=UPI00397CEA54